MDKTGYVYMLASKKHGTLYIGVTSDLVKRIWQHKHQLAEGFTRKYAVHLLVWFDCYDSIYKAITKEKQMKKWNRAWKIDMIEQTNPEWRDLYDEII